MRKYLLGLMLLTACTAKKEEVVEVQTLEVSTPISLDTTIHQEFVADIHAVQNVEIRARVKGYLDRILVDEGKQVKKGQVMFTINSQECYFCKALRAIRSIADPTEYSCSWTERRAAAYVSIS